MPRTHHATRTFRLSCGCLRDYPGMATGKVHHVLCVVCGVAATTLYAYPDKRCGVTANRRNIAGVVHHLTCTREPGDDLCRHSHFDQYMQTTFYATGSVQGGQYGETRRA